MVSVCVKKNLYQQCSASLLYNTEKSWQGVLFKVCHPEFLNMPSLRDSGKRMGICSLLQTCRSYEATELRRKSPFLRIDSEITCKSCHCEERSNEAISTVAYLKHPDKSGCCSKSLRGRSHYVWNAVSCEKFHDSSQHTRYRDQRDDLPHRNRHVWCVSGQSIDVWCQLSPHLTVGSFSSLPTPPSSSCSVDVEGPRWLCVLTRPDRWV